MNPEAALTFISIRSKIRALKWDKADAELAKIAKAVHDGETQREVDARIHTLDTEGHVPTGKARNTCIDSERDVLDILEVTRHSEDGFFEESTWTARFRDWRRRKRRMVLFIDAVIKEFETYQSPQLTRLKNALYEDRLLGGKVAEAMLKRGCWPSKWKHEGFSRFMFSEELQDWLQIFLPVLEKHNTDYKDADPRGPHEPFLAKLDAVAAKFVAELPQRRSQLDYRTANFITSERNLLTNGGNGRRSWGVLEWEKGAWRLSKSVLNHGLFNMSRPGGRLKPDEAATFKDDFFNKIKELNDNVYVHTANMALKRDSMEQDMEKWIKDEVKKKFPRPMHFSPRERDTARPASSPRAARPQVDAPTNDNVKTGTSSFEYSESPEPPSPGARESVVRTPSDAEQGSRRVSSSGPSPSPPARKRQDRKATPAAPSPPPRVVREEDAYARSHGVIPLSEDQLVEKLGQAPVVSPWETFVPENQDGKRLLRYRETRTGYTTSQRPPCTWLVPGWVGFFPKEDPKTPAFWNIDNGATSWGHPLVN
ncbi:unnamed protein product [Amoebophrya sp. A120]|nr:unnamed protein product [Amoebophrya sp. A120]|eukprot:GSA120T00004155001.1